MIQQPTGPSIWHLLRRCLYSLLLILPMILLMSCGHKWRITKVVVNPHPLAGTGTVFPVVLYAPSTQNVIMEATLERSPNFSNSILFEAEVFYTNPEDNKPYFADLYWIYPAVTSNHFSGTILFVGCTEKEDPGGESSVELFVLGRVNEALNLTVSGASAASTRIYIAAVSKDSGSDTYVSQDAATPLDITCLKRIPVPPVLKNLAASVTPLPRAGTQQGYIVTVTEIPGGTPVLQANVTLHNFGANGNNIETFGPLPTNGNGQVTFNNVALHPMIGSHIVSGIDNRFARQRERLFISPTLTVELAGYNTLTVALLKDTL